MGQHQSKQVLDSPHPVDAIALEKQHNRAYSIDHQQLEWPTTKTAREKQPAIGQGEHQ